MLSNYEFAERDCLSQMKDRTTKEDQRLEQLNRKYQNECDKDDEESYRARREA